jgi:Bacterial SH3 domain
MNPDLDGGLTSDVSARKLESASFGAPQADIGKQTFAAVPAAAQLGSPPPATLADPSGKRSDAADAPYGLMATGSPTTELASASLASSSDPATLTSAQVGNEQDATLLARAPSPSKATSTLAGGGTAIDQVGVVAWSGDPQLRLRSSPSTDSRTITSMPFNTRVQVIKEFPGDWFYLSTTHGQIGYADKKHIKTNLPEPNAKLHSVAGGQDGFAVNIATKYYGAHFSGNTQGLRFYVGVLAWANKHQLPANAKWQETQFQAKNLIWIPSAAFAETLRGVVDSGSNNFFTTGVENFAHRTGQLWHDVSGAIAASGKYLPAAVQRHVEQSLWGMLESLALTLAGAAGVLAVSTAIGAAIGSLAGGVGAAPGAAAGFQVGMVLLEWLGLAFLATWVAQSLTKLGGSFGAFIGAVWGAHGDAGKVDAAAHQFAESIGTLCGVVLEGLVLWATSVGVAKAMSTLGGTQFGAAFKGSKAGEWLTKRVNAVKSGESGVPTPADVWTKFSWSRQAIARRLEGIFGPEASRAHFKPIGPDLVSVHGELKISGRALNALKDGDLQKLVELCKNKGPKEAYEYFESSSTNGGKPGARLRFESRLNARAEEVATGILESVGISRGDPRAKIFENMSEGDKTRLWDLFNEQAFKNKDLRVQATEWALRKQPANARELVAEMQFYDAEVGKQADVLFEHAKQTNQHRLAEAAQKKGSPLSKQESATITKAVTNELLGKPLEAIADAAKKAARAKVLADAHTKSAADHNWQTNLDAQTGDKAPHAVSVGTLSDAELPAHVRAKAGELTFGSKADGAYHAHKHAGELHQKTTAANEMEVYLQEARALIRDHAGVVRHNQNGSRSVVVEGGTQRAIIAVTADGKIFIATFGSK